MRTETNYSGRRPQEPGRADQIQRAAEMNRPQSEQQSRAWQVLKWFERTARTEAAFHIRFRSLPAEDAELLKAFYHITEDSELLSRICRFWDVGQSAVQRHAGAAI
jgi:hypothetical protein